MITNNHPFLKFLARLPQFQTQLLMGSVIHMETGAVVSKYDGGDEPKHRYTLNIWWPGYSTEGAWVDGLKYIQMQCWAAGTLAVAHQDLYDADLQDAIEAAESWSPK